MKEVPNPFMLFDNFLLDRVCNPISWKVEYQFGKDAINLRLYALFLAHVLLATLAVAYMNSYIVFGVIALSAVHHWQKNSWVRSRWVRNNKTGKNVARVNYFWFRMIQLAWSVFIPAIFSTNNSLVEILVVTSICQLFFTIPEYLEAVDAMPPGYHERKAAARYT